MIAIREAWRRAADRSKRRAVTATLGARPALVIPDETVYDPLAQAVRQEEQELIRAAVGQLPNGIGRS